jgi:protocatechuate 3,4-dioxygenase beta subunit
MPGVRVAFDAAGEVRAETVSGANGAFELPAPRVAGEVTVLDPDLESLFRFKPRPEAELDMLLVVARHRRLAGSVHDVAGRPLPGARVALVLPAEFATRFDAVFDAADRGQWSGPCDGDGRFDLERVPLVAGANVEARLDGYVTSTIADPGGERLDLELVLDRPAEDVHTIAGRVVDGSGRPVPGALVSLGKRSAATDTEGEFVLERTEAEDAFELVAAHRGHLPGRYRATAGASGEPAWPAWVELVLGGAPLELAGRVVDEEGRPRPGVKLWLADPTHFGTIDEDLEAQVENLVAPEGSTYEDGDAYYGCTRTDDEGRFRLQGLLAREYRLGLLDTQTLDRLETAPFAAGREDLRLELPRAPLATLGARLVSRAGRPVPGVHVTLHAPTFGGVHHPRDAQISDADGHLRFEKVAGRELSLWIRGDDVVPDVRTLPVDHPDEIELTVDALCHVKVDLSDARADGLFVLDAEGNRLGLHEIGSDGVWTRSEWELVDGRSVTLGVSDLAETLVLVRGDQEVERVPLQLEPGRLECIRR